jgi:hypothetical protein
MPSEPEESGPIEQASDGGEPGADGARTNHDVPDPDERGRVYDAMRAQAAASAAERPEPGSPPNVADRRSYRDEVPRFLDTAADHEKRRPMERQPMADCSADPPGSYRSRGGSYLSPERHAETGETIRRVREIEPEISEDVQVVERENAYGGWLDGFEFRLKDEDRLKEKVAEGLAVIGPDASPKEILEQVPDAIRYTFCLTPETYTQGYYDIKERLESLGYEMYQSKNSWDAAEYKGVNTRWVTQEGQRFEVQLHTPDSFHAKQYLTHRAYERIRNPLTTDVEREELEAFQREVSSWIQIPDGAAGIPDFKKEGF